MKNANMPSLQMINGWVQKISLTMCSFWNTFLWCWSAQHLTLLPWIQRVQIFCLINCAPLHVPPIKFGQLTFLIKWDNSDFNTHFTKVLTLKSLSFFFFGSFYFFSILAFGFFFFSSPCGLSLAAAFGIDLDSSPILLHCNPFSQSQEFSFCFCFCEPQRSFCPIGADLFQLLRGSCCNKQRSRLVRIVQSHSKFSPFGWV